MIGDMLENLENMVDYGKKHITTWDAPKDFDSGETTQHFGAS